MGYGMIINIILIIKKTFYSHKVIKTDFTCIEIIMRCPFEFKNITTL